MSITGQPDLGNENLVTLVNPKTGEEVLIAKVSADGRNVEIPQTFERPLSVSLSELFLHTEPGAIEMRQSKAKPKSDARMLVVGSLSAAMSVIDHGLVNEQSLACGVDIGLAKSVIQDAINQLMGSDDA